MAEDDPDQNPNGRLIAGLETGDIVPAVYEGGFKTWECAVDLARVATGDYRSVLGEGEDLEVIEVYIP